MNLAELNNLCESFPAVAGSVPRARTAVAELAGLAGASEDQIDAVKLATSEAITNAVLHAYRDDPGEIHVAAAVTAGELWVLVADDGAGLRPHADSPGLGVGLALIAQATDDFSVVRRAGVGTELRMRFRLRGAGSSRAAQVRGSRDSASRPASPRFSTTR
jgi:serine/threonine-protein kinase RsbW